VKQWKVNGEVKRQKRSERNGKEKESEREQGQQTRDKQTKGQSPTPTAQTKLYASNAAKRSNSTAEDSATGWQETKQRTVDTATAAAINASNLIRTANERQKKHSEQKQAAFKLAN